MRKRNEHSASNVYSLVTKRSDRARALRPKKRPARKRLPAHKRSPAHKPPARTIETMALDRLVELENAAAAICRNALDHIHAALTRARIQNTVSAHAARALALAERIETLGSAAISPEESTPGWLPTCAEMLGSLWSDHAIVAALDANRGAIHAAYESAVNDDTLASSLRSFLAGRLDRRYWNVACSHTNLDLQ